MSSEKLVKVTLSSNDEDKVVLNVEIRKEEMIQLFTEYDFRRNFDAELSRRIVKEIPLATINEITKKIDLDAVAKIATIELAQKSAGRNY